MYTRPGIVIIREYILYDNECTLTHWRTPKHPKLIITNTPHKIFLLAAIPKEPSVVLTIIAHPSWPSTRHHTITQSPLGHMNKAKCETLSRVCIQHIIYIYKAKYIDEYLLYASANIV